VGVLRKISSSGYVLYWLLGLVDVLVSRPFVFI